MSRFIADRAYDYFDLGDESEQESAESSEDEIDIILHGTPEQRRRLRHSHEKERQQKTAKRSVSGQSKSLSLPHSDMQQSSSEDEFEKEMNAELNDTVHVLEETRGTRITSGTASISDPAPPKESSKQSSNGTSKNPVYDDIYFDSDDEDNYDGQGASRVQRQHTKPSDDDLLYDPDMDDADQRWVDQQRRRQHGGNSQLSSGRNGKGKKPAAPKTDANLDCPACMTTLCLDCQRHDIYPNQYRAMFVMNCKVNSSELLSVPEQAAKKFKKSKSSREGQGDPAESAAEQSSSSAPKDMFHPVLCEECDTVVGVVDVDDVYHFFNVLASH